MSGYKIEDFLPNDIHMALLSEAASLEVPPAFLIVQIVNDRYAEDESAELEPANSALAYEDEVVEADESYAEATPPEGLKESSGGLAEATEEALEESIEQEEDVRAFEPLRVVSADELTPEFVEQVEHMLKSTGPDGEAIVRSESRPEVDPVSQSHPIDEHGLSNRARNALVRNGVLTPEDLTSLSLDDIKGLDGVGVKSYDEIAALVDSLDVGAADGVVVIHDEEPEPEVGVITHDEEPEPEAGWDDDHPDDEQDAELSFYRSGLAAALAETNTQIRIAKMSELTMARLNACSTGDEKAELGKTIKMNVSRAKMGEDTEVQKLANILIGSLPVRPAQVQQLIELGAELGYDATEVRTSLAAANFGGRSLRMLNFTEGEEFLAVLQDKLAQSAPEDDGVFFEDDGFFEEMEGDDDSGDLFG